MSNIVYVPKITDGSFVVGATVQPGHGYNNLTPCAWGHHCVVLADGSRRFIFVTGHKGEARSE